MNETGAYAGLFATAFLAATILPAQSEAVLSVMLVSGSFSPFWLLVVASAGNVLGSTVNWWLGRGIDRFSDRKWYPIGPDAVKRFSAWYRHCGRWSLLASWVPIVGDPLTVVAGVVREPFWSFLALVTVAKVGRYLVLAAALANWV